MGKGALNDTPAFAPAFTKKHGRARVAIGDGVDIHGRCYALMHGNKSYLFRSFFGLLHRKNQAESMI